MDRIFIEALAIECTIGIHDWERTIQQTLLLDLAMACDQRRPAASDALADTIDYSAVAAVCREVAEQGRFGLIETLAERIAERILSDWPVAEVEVVCRKPSALPGAACAGVRIRRGRDG